MPELGGSRSSVAPISRCEHGRSYGGPRIRYRHAVRLRPTGTLNDPGGKGTVIPKASTTVLAATKLHIPALRPGHLHRATLVAALIAHSDSRVILVAAAPGSGKRAAPTSRPDERER